MIRDGERFIRPAALVDARPDQRRNSALKRCLNEAG
jgi:hypothetical protein